MEWVPGRRDEFDIWKNSLEWQPVRVLDALRIPSLYSDPNDWGDTYSCVYIVMAALYHTNFDKPPSSWPYLVHGGIIDLLCTIALQKDHQIMPLLYHEQPQEVPSVWYYPIGIIAGAVKDIRKPLNESDRLLVQTLKKYWTSLAQKMWDDPGNMMSDEDRLGLKRTVLGMVLMPCLVADPSFFDLAACDDGITIPLVVRVFLHCFVDKDGSRVGSQEASIMTSLLSGLLIHREDSTTPSSHLHTLKLLVKGCGDKGTISPLYEKLVSMMTAFDDNTAGVCADILRMVSQTLQPFPAHYDHFLRDQNLWERLLTWMRQCVRSPSSPENNPDANQGGDRDPTIGTSLKTVIGIVLYGLEYGKNVAPNVMHAFMVCLVNAGLLEFIEESWLFYTSRPSIRFYGFFHKPEIPVQALLNFTYHSLTIVSSTSSPSLKSILRSHLPRPRLLRALLDSAFFVNEEFVNPSIKLEAASPEQVAFQINYRHWIRIEATCQQDRSCGRRGCTNHARHRCSTCKTVHYCGKECQAKDWKEHKLVCGFQLRRLTGPSTGDVFDEITLPVTMSRKAGVSVVKSAYIPMSCL